MAETVFVVVCLVSFIADGWLYRRYADPRAPAGQRWICGAVLIGLLVLQLGTVAWVAFGGTSS